jgi:hypothetical protein
MKARFGKSGSMKGSVALFDLPRRWEVRAMLRWALVFLICGFAMAQTNLVPNGDFERDENGDGVPDFWMTAGAPHVKQQLVRDVGREGKGFSGKLICTEFGNGTPASHAMICQVGTISVQRGRWYRLSF